MKGNPFFIVAEVAIQEYTQRWPQPIGCELLLIESFQAGMTHSQTAAAYFSRVSKTAEDWNQTSIDQCKASL